MRKGPGGISHTTFNPPAHTSPAASQLMAVFFRQKQNKNPKQNNQKQKQGRFEVYLYFCFALLSTVSSGSSHTHKDLGPAVLTLLDPLLWG